MCTGYLLVLVGMTLVANVGSYTNSSFNSHALRSEGFVVVKFTTTVVDNHITSSY